MHTEFLAERLFPYVQVHGIVLDVVLNLVHHTVLHIVRHNSVGDEVPVQSVAGAWRSAWHGA